MAKGKRSSSYELVLEDRHLLGVFFAVVVLCALFFTLGFVLGRNQTTSQVASASAPQVEAPSEPPAAKPEELSFFDRLQGKPPAEKLPAATSKRSAPAPSKAPPKPSPAPAKQAQARASEARAAPLYLQVAAVTQQPDAQRLARELQKLGFSPVLRPPRSDRFYRVQVGPFDTAELANAAKSRLEAHGFKAFIRR